MQFWSKKMLCLSNIFVFDSTTIHFQFSTLQLIVTLVVVIILINNKSSFIMTVVFLTTYDVLCLKVDVAGQDDEVAIECKNDNDGFKDGQNDYILITNCNKEIIVIMLISPDSCSKLNLLQVNVNGRQHRSKHFLFESRLAPHQCPQELARCKWTIAFEGTRYTNQTILICEAFSLVEERSTGGAIFRNVSGISGYEVVGHAGWKWNMITWHILNECYYNK